MADAIHRDGDGIVAAFSHPRKARRLHGDGEAHGAASAIGTQHRLVRIIGIREQEHDGKAFYLHELILLPARLFGNIKQAADITTGGPKIAKKLLLLVSVHSESLLSLVCRYLMLLSFLSARHNAAPYPYGIL